MASNITTTVDENYPVAGQDNDTQGFRDNFATIKSSLIAAKTEIEDLQDKAVLKSALTDSTLENNLQGNNLVNATLVESKKSFADGGTLGTQPGQVGSELSFVQGHYQRFTVNKADWQFTFAGWPDTGFAKITVELVSSDPNGSTITFSVSQGTFNVSSVTWPTSPGDKTLFVGNDTNPTIVEFWVADYETTRIIFGNYLGQFN